ncbi:head-tail connector protein [Rhizobium sp. C4]|uniref:head-tail connector protein n=1 Tax=Rhizobium sp. C4 TaxID=1349800 RepID=UPI001E4B54EB|nr:head-tail connector protein [Rhizobium sp. C4]MCD2172030.1 head-tail connector protein [Rhizobium sp. C4]
MTHTIIAPPAAEPLTLAQVKAHLRLDGSTEDALLAGLIATARHYLEATTGLALITQTLRFYRDDWPEDGLIQLAIAPLQTVESVTVYDASGNPQAVSLAGHVLDAASTPARLFLATQPPTSRPLNGIEIDVVAGFGNTGAEMPDTLTRAMLMHVALMFELRGAVPAEMQPAAIPAGYDRLVSPYRPVRL